MRGISSDINVRHKFEQVSTTVQVPIPKFIPSTNLQQLEKLVKQWQELHHANVMPCIGLTMQLGPIPALIFPMCSEGSIVRYVENHPEASKLDLVHLMHSVLSNCYSPIVKVGPGDSWYQLLAFGICSQTFSLQPTTHLK